MAFERLGCVSCHEGGRESDAPPRAELARNPKTISQMAGLMWNHAPEMARAADAAGRRWSTMTPQQTADLITYFFSMRFYQQAGDTAAGKMVLQEKNCHACYSQSDLAAYLRDDQGAISPIQVARMMWEHGLEMLKKMEESGFQISDEENT